ncbi:hypothetical protein [Brevibacterium oceani]|uniref:hypothetical protein n=1 Tax=Brevibacterium oceani TaxID=358099 RepID=UPI001B345684|nr:hypothetical protein [Brevibacterium oceani]
MSLQPLRISPGRKFAAGLAGIFTMSVTLTVGFLITSLTLISGDPGEPTSEKLFFIALAVLAAIISVVVCHLLMRAALGRRRTGGSLTRFFRYQLAALGCGGGLALGFLPAMTEAAPAWWLVSIAAGVGLIAVCLLAFRKARYPILDHPPHPIIGLAEGSVVDYWSGTSARAPSLAVIHFVDTRGRDRWVRHLVQQSPSMQGTIGQVTYDRHRPDRVLRFAVTHQLLDRRPPQRL